jgi:predicted nucleic acid-binding protein
LTTADTSVVVAGFASWHEGHAAARAALTNAVRLPAHVALEVYSVLTRLPPPHRATSSIVLDFLEARFRKPYLTLPASGHRSLLRGALYDALVAATAREAGATLLTRDRRAVRVYEALGAPFRLVE